MGTFVEETLMRRRRGRQQLDPRTGRLVDEPPVETYRGPIDWNVMDEPQQEPAPTEPPPRSYVADKLLNREPPGNYVRDRVMGNPDDRAGAREQLLNKVLGERRHLQDNPPDASGYGAGFRNNLAESTARRQASDDAIAGGIEDIGQGLRGIKTYVDMGDVKGPAGVMGFGGDTVTPALLKEAGVNRRFQRSSDQRDRSLDLNSQRMEGTQSRHVDSMGMRERALQSAEHRAGAANELRGRSLDLAENKFGYQKGNVPDIDRRALAANETAVRAVDDLAARFNPEEIGPIQGRWNQVARHIGLNDADAVRTAGDLQYAILMQVYAQSGKAINQEEMKRMAASLPQMTDNPETFLTMLDGLKERLSRQQDTSLDLMETQGRDVAPYRQYGGGQGGSTYVRVMNPDTGEEQEVDQQDVEEARRRGWRVVQ